jgi:hypothetical protein
MRRTVGAVDDFDAESRFGDGHGHREGVAGGMPACVGDEFADQQLCILEPRLADQVQIAVERRERLAGRGRRFGPAGQLQGQQCGL